MPLHLMEWFAVDLMSTRPIAHFFKQAHPRLCILYNFDDGHPFLARLCPPGLRGGIDVTILIFCRVFSVTPFFSHSFNSGEKGWCVFALSFAFLKVPRSKYEDQALANCASYAIYDYTNEIKNLLHVNERASIAFPIENDRASWTLLGAQ